MDSEKTSKKHIIGWLCIVALIVGCFFLYKNVYAPIQERKEIAIEKEIQAAKLTYHRYTVTTTDPKKEIVELFGDNLTLVLDINRIDVSHIRKGAVLMVPDDFSDPAIFAPFPEVLSSAYIVPKLMVVSQQMQAFGVYEYGMLVRWGPVSTGKALTPTPSRLYFTNWKGLSVTSTVDDAWVMPWYFNLENKLGVSMHQYELPGYPASHACVRLLEDDAIWLYHWADQWKLSPNGETIQAYGTPVIIFGAYEYKNIAPWKHLVETPNNASIDQESMEKVLTRYLPEILRKIEK
jgi:hypothetical protein